MAYKTRGIQYITPMVATPDDVEHRARIPSHVVTGMYHIRVYEPFVSLGDYNGFLEAAAEHLYDPLVAEAYEWLRDNYSAYELGGIFGFIVYNVN